MILSTPRHVAIFTILAAIFFVGHSAIAAPPYTIDYHGTPVTTAVPGKSFTINFEVTNTGTTVYSDVKVIFHIPDGLTHSKVSPTDANIVDNTITWKNVPIAAGKSFYPSLTLTLDSNTKLKTKERIWVQVTGTDLEENSQNFSITAVSKATTPATTTTSGSDLISRINSIHRAVYDRNPTVSEHTYWLGRVTSGAKATFGALLGAMQFHQQNNIRH